MKRGSAVDAAVERAVKRGVSRLAPLATPWLVAAAEAPTIAVAHAAWGGDPVTTPLVALGMGAAGAGVAAYTYHAGKGRDRHTQVMGTLTCAAAAGAATVGTVVGLGPIAWVYGVGAAALAAAYNIRHLMRGADHRSARGLAALAEAIGAERAAIRNVRRSGKGTVSAQVQVAPGSGATLEEVAEMVPRLAAHFGAPPGRATLRPDPEHAGRGHLQVVVADLLKDPIPWPGPAHVGGLPTKPIPVGVYETGQVVEVHLLDPRTGLITHLLIGGATGSGKSEFARVVLGTLVTRRQVSVVVLDCSKGLQTMGPLVHGLEWLITNYGEARRFLKVMPRVVQARTDYLAARGLDSWQPGCGLNLLVVWVEEASDLADDGAAYMQLLRTARSAGIIVVNSLQRASWRGIDTDVRSQHGAAACFGVRDVDDAAFVLPDEVISAGAVPTWGAYRPGYAYLTGWGTRPEDWTRVLRGYRITDKTALARAVSDAAAARTPLDQVTAQAFGELYTRRTRYPHPVGVELPATQPPTPATDPGAHTGHATPHHNPAVSHDDPDEMDEQMRAELDQIRAEILHPITAAEAELPDGERHDDVDVSTDIPPLNAGITFSGANADPAQARALLDQQLHEWVRGGRTQFSPRDLYPLLQRVGRGRRWFYHARDELLAAGVIGEGDEVGTYTLLRSPRDTPARV